MIQFTKEEKKHILRQATFLLEWKKELDDAYEARWI